MTAYVFVNERHQHAVGHGFFHTASVDTGSGPRFEYVYDCGAKQRKRLLAPIIEAYSASLGRSPIDLLVLSHFHADHVNGLDLLFKRKHIETAIIPYVTAAERLLLVARILKKADAGFDDVQFAAAPEKWLRSRGVTRIVTVASSGEPPIAPEPPRRVPDMPPRAAGWELRLGSESGRILADTDSIGDNSPVVLRSDHLAVWEFLFFCWNANAQVHNFAAMIKAETGRSPEELLEPNALPETIRDTTTRKQILKCYGMLIGKAFNWTTLCLRAGPREGAKRVHYIARAGIGATPMALARGFDASRPGGLAWLGTGDLELADPDVSQAFFAHYAGRGSVATLSLPHHGSKKNFDGDLLAEFKPSLIFATCPPASDHHPDTQVVQAVIASGTLFQKVEDSVQSQLHESVRFTVAGR